MNENHTNPETELAEHGVDVGVALSEGGPEASSAGGPGGLSVDEAAAAALAAGVDPEVVDAIAAPPKVLSLAEIEQTRDIKRAEVEIPEWGGTVIVQGLDYATWREIGKASLDADGELDEEASATRMLIAGLVEPAVDEQTVQILFRKGVGAVGQINLAIARCSGLDADSPKDFERLFREIR